MSEDIVVVTETIEDACTEMVAREILREAVSNDKILANFTENKFNRSFNRNMPAISKMRRIATIQLFVNT